MTDTETRLRAALKPFADMGTADHPHGVTALAWYDAITEARAATEQTNVVELRPVPACGMPSCRVC